MTTPPSFCGKCGKPAEPADTFCRACGVPVGKPAGRLATPAHINSGCMKWMVIVGSAVVVLIAISVVMGDNATKPTPTSPNSLPAQATNTETQARDTLYEACQNANVGGTGPPLKCNCYLPVLKSYFGSYKRAVDARPWAPNAAELITAAYVVDCE